MFTQFPITNFSFIIEKFATPITRRTDYLFILLKTGCPALAEMNFTPALSLYGLGLRNYQLLIPNCEFHWKFAIRNLELRQHCLGITRSLLVAGFPDIAGCASRHRCREGHLNSFKDYLNISSPSEPDHFSAGRAITFVREMWRRGSQIHST